MILNCLLNDLLASLSNAIESTDLIRCCTCFLIQDLKHGWVTVYLGVLKRQFTVTSLTI